MPTKSGGGRLEVLFSNKPLLFLFNKVTQTRLGRCLTERVTTAIDLRLAAAAQEGGRDGGVAGRGVERGRRDRLV